jgi:YD repeat-containing protein
MLMRRTLSCFFILLNLFALFAWQKAMGQSSVLKYEFDFNQPADIGVRTSAEFRLACYVREKWHVPLKQVDSLARVKEEKNDVATDKGVVSSEYDAYGNVTKRVFADVRTQTLTWDVYERLVKVAERNAANTSGYDWTAIYDGLGRRLQTT